MANSTRFEPSQPSASSIRSRTCCPTTGGATGIVRSGQIVGDSANGVWNSDEACSLILRSVGTLRVLPNRDVAGSSVCWLPVDHAAWAISRLTRRNPHAKRRDVWNIAARSQPYSAILAWIAQDHSLPPCDVVEYDSWVSALRKAIEQGHDVPAAKLLEFFSASNSAGAHVDLRVSTKELRETLRTLKAEGMVDAAGELGRRLNSMEQGLLKRIFDTWREDGLF